MQICYIPAPKKNYQQFQNEVQFLKKNFKRELKGCNAKEKAEITTAVLSLALINVNTIATELNTVGGKGIDNLGAKAMDILKPVAFWLGVIFAMIDVVKNIKNQDVMCIPKVVIRYAIMVAAVWNMPRIFQFVIKAIADCFDN